MLYQQTIIVLLTALLGGVFGHFNKCKSGACPLTSSWWRGALYGAAVGLLLVAAR